MSSITTALKTLSDKRKAIAAESRAAAQKILGPGLKAFMLENPNIEAVRWAQYTPYFNDGDTCEFGVGELYFKLVGGDPEAGDDGDGFQYLSAYTARKEGYIEQDWFKALNELSAALESSEEELLAAFGDHVRVTVTQSGVDIEEYEHD